ncbi:MAG: hypothetical protein GY868_04860, partial [Deltaproteobacteria bacterium]|nr:hypothetical protein [Deltaproteobacteria bacterium]
MKEIVRGEQSSKQGGVLQGAEQLLRLGIAGQAQQALTESVRLGLFTVLGGRALRVETIAEKLALQVTALQRLLRVLVVL